jgi:hypothetical protein
MDGRIALSQKKMRQAYVLSRLITDKTFTIAQAAEVMGISERQTTRLKVGFRITGFLQIGILKIGFLASA